MTIYDCRLRKGADGRIAEKVETVNGRTRTWTYAYDKQGRLTEARLDNRLVCQCHYDREGRRSQDCFPLTHDVSLRNYRYTLDNRLQTAGNNLFTHDENGFRSIWNCGGNYTLYGYAPDYRLLKAEKRETGEIFEFTHDDQGRRAIKQCNGEPVEAYRWLDLLRLASFHDGESAYEFVYQDGERTPYAMQRDDGAVAYLYYDQVGSLRVVADSDGDVIKEVLYDPFGGIMEDTNPNFRIPIGFAGGLHDRDLGFVRFGWRDYDTFTSRWTAPDPLGDAGGDSDWYGYCLDDPVNGVDPLGLEADCISAEMNAAGFGLKGELGGGICWDDKGEFRGMGHVDAGASSGWGSGVSGTWQNTDASSVDDLAGQSLVTGVSAPVVVGPWGSRVTAGVDTVHTQKYNGKAYSGGLGWGSPTMPEVHTQSQHTVLWGGKK